MRRLAQNGSRLSEIRNKAVQLTNNLEQKDFRGESCACLRYCRDYIRYVRDIYDCELLHYPETVLHVGAGDCDDKAILLASLLASIGHQVRFIAVAFEANFYCHVWVQDFVNGAWIDLEATEPLECGQRIPDDGAVHYLTCELTP